MTVVNEELLATSEYFASAERQRELGAFFGFAKRRVIFGVGALETLGAECRQLGAGRVLLVRDPGVAFLDTAVQAALDKDSIEVVGIFDEVIPNPSVESVDRCAQVIRDSGCEALITVGGGSTMDTVKTARCVARAGGTIADYFGFDLVPDLTPLPMIGIPTTAGTGAEVSRVAVVVAENGKQAVYSEFLTPDVALVDPNLSKSLPPVLTATTGLDALGHALECTASKKSNDLGDAVAREALRAGCPHIERAIEHGADDFEARVQMARCSLLAGLLLSPVNTGAGHALGYGIEKVAHAKGYSVPHGTAVALMLPGVMRHNMAAVADKYYYAAGVAGLDLGGKSREEGVYLAADWVDRMRRKHTDYASLADAGLDESDIPQMVEIAMEVRRLLDPNPVEVRVADAERIYREVLV